MIEWELAFAGQSLRGDENNLKSKLCSKLSIKPSLKKT